MSPEGSEFLRPDFARDPEPTEAGTRGPEIFGDPDPGLSRAIAEAELKAAVAALTATQREEGDDKKAA